MLCKRVQTKGKIFTRDETHKHSLHPHRLLPHAVGSWSERLQRAREKQRDLLRWPHKQCQAQFSSRVCSAWGLQTGQARVHSTGSRRSGKSITLSSSATAVTCPAWGIAVFVPHSPGTCPQDAAHPWPRQNYQWPWLEQQLPAGDGRANSSGGFWHTSPTTTSRDTAAAAGTGQQESPRPSCMEGRAGPASSPAPQPTPSACPSSHSHSVSITSQGLEKPGSWHTKGSRTQSPWCPPAQTRLCGIKALPRSSSVGAQPGRSENTQPWGFSPISSGNEAA